MFDVLSLFHCLVNSFLLLYFLRTLGLDSPSCLALICLWKWRHRFPLHSSVEYMFNNMEMFYFWPRRMFLLVSEECGRRFVSFQLHFSYFILLSVVHCSCSTYEYFFNRSETTPQNSKLCSFSLIKNHFFKACINWVHWKWYNMNTL